MIGSAAVASRLRRMLLASMMICGIIAAPKGVIAQQVVAKDAAYSVGVDGHYRIGRWVGIRTQPSMETASIETRDGDGIRVRFDSPESSAWTYLVPGSEAAPLTFLSAEGEPVLASRLPTAGSPSRGPAMIPLSMPWVMIVGDPLGIDQIGVNELLDRDATIAVSRPKTANQFPDSVLGYDGIDMLVVGASGSKLLSAMSAQQSRAMSDFVSGGGQMMVTLGGSADELLTAAPWILTLIGVQSVPSATIDPSAVETFTSSQTPLKPFAGVRLPKDRGDVLILGRTTNRLSTPIAARYAAGFGTILAVAADLESEQFAAWPERLDLISQLTGSAITQDNRNIDRGSRTSRATAYNDLAGQLRSTLDRFSIQRKFNFSVLALSLMALIAAIGPLDYFLVNRLLGKPLLGWVSFPIMAIGFSAVLASQSSVVVGPTAAGNAAAGNAAARNAAARSGAAVRCNRLEIVDVNAIDGVGRGYSANYLYSHEASLFDVSIASTGPLQTIAPELGRSLIGPLGYPGESFGGIQISLEDSRLPAYRVATKDSAGLLTSSLVGLPLAPRSSNGFFSQYSFIPKFSDVPAVRRRSGSELLQGDWTNPLPIDLLDGKLVYRNWVYILPTRIRAGQSIASLDKLRQKNFRWLLSRQKALESDTQTQAWDPAAGVPLERIAEMMMFHEAAGGTQYTNLAHDPLEDLDLSHLLMSDRCILFGRVDQPLTTVNVSQGEDSITPAGEQLTMIRVVLPVTTKR